LVEENNRDSSFSETKIFFSQSTINFKRHCHDPDQGIQLGENCTLMPFLLELFSIQIVLVSLKEKNWVALVDILIWLYAIETILGHTIKSLLIA